MYSSLQMLYLASSVLVYLVSLQYLPVIRKQRSLELATTDANCEINEKTFDVHR